MASTLVPLNEEEFMDVYEYSAGPDDYVEYHGLGYESSEAEEAEEAEPELPTEVYDEFTSTTLTWGDRLEDYAPIRAIGPCPVFFGPHPPALGRELSGLNFYMDKGIESIYTTTLEEQAEIARWFKVRDAMNKVRWDIENAWYRSREPHRHRFYMLMDSISSWGCYLCEYANHRHEGGFERDYCICDECRGCGSKYCDGCYSNDE